MFKKFVHFSLSVLELKVMLVTRAGIHKLHVRIANMDDPDHTASEEAPNFRISTVHAVLHQNISDGICS